MPQDTLVIPALVATLSKKSKGNPIAWAEKLEHVVIVFQDGRKLTFNRADIPALLAEDVEVPAEQAKESAATAATGPAPEVEVKRKPRARV